MDHLKLSTLLAAKQAQPPSEPQLELISKWVAILSEHHRKEISQPAMWGYCEGLKDLTLNQIEEGFYRALKEVDRMPSVAHVRDLAQPVVRETVWSNAEMAPALGKYCDRCYPDGWLVFTHPVHGHPFKAARRCDCQARGGIAVVK